MQAILFIIPFNLGIELLGLLFESREFEWFGAKKSVPSPRKQDSGHTGICLPVSKLWFKQVLPRDGKIWGMCRGAKA